MSDTKKCKYCQSDIDKKAKICPNCRKKQGGKGKFILIGAVVIIILSAALNQDSDDTKQVENITKEESSSSVNTNKAIEFGSEASSNDLVLKVNEVGDSKEIKESQFISYKPDSGKYALVNVTIKNAGKESTSLTNGYFKLITVDDIEYSPTILIGLDNNYISFESINPGLDITGYLVFEVPDDLVVSDATLRFSGIGLFTSATDFKLK